MEPSPRSKCEILCSICHESINSGDDLGEINSCKHRFCFECINKWREIENSCPCCKLRFTTIFKKVVASPSKLSRLLPTSTVPGTIVGVEECQETNQRPQFEDPSFEEWIQGIACVVCGTGENEEQLLLCDDCDNACHSYCAGLDDIPEGDWFCEGCSARRRREAEQQGQRRRQRQGTTATTTTARRRRTRTGPENVATVVILDSSSSGSSGSEKEEEEARRRRRRRRTTATVRNELDDFIVSDDSSDDGAFDYSGEDVQDGARARGGGGGARRRRRRGMNVPVIESESDEEEEEEWKSDSYEEEEEEDHLTRLGLDAPRPRRQQQEVVAPGQWRQVVRTRGGEGRYRSIRGRQRQPPAQQQPAVIDLTQQQQTPPSTSIIDTISLSAKLRADIAACRERGARLPSSHGTCTTSEEKKKTNAMPPPHPPPPPPPPITSVVHLYPATTFHTPQSRFRIPRRITDANTSNTPNAPNTNTLSSEGRHRMRTVRDYVRGAEIARGTTGTIGSGGGGSSAAEGANLHQPRQHRSNTTPYLSMPLQQRLAARAAAEWGTSTAAPTATTTTTVLTVENKKSSERERPPWRQTKRPPPATTTNNTNTTNTYTGRSSMHDDTNNQNKNSNSNNGNASTVDVLLASPSPQAPPSLSPPLIVNKSNTTDTPPNYKTHAFNLVKPHIDVLLSAGALSREQYKQVARRATQQLCEGKDKGERSGLRPSSQQLCALVDRVFTEILREGN